MGSSIVVALLLADHPVIAIAPLTEELEKVPKNIRDQIMHCSQSGLLHQPVDYYLEKLTISGNYKDLSGCRMVIECVIENKDVKKQVFSNISDVVSHTAIIASNTSAIPISMLQGYVTNPERFLGIHWAEPAYMTRFLEITCGEKTGAAFADFTFNVAHLWGKEPTLLKKDIRGFVTNRLMYSVYREGLTIAENGEATFEDMDKAFRYDAGSWMTLMGVFRRMDYLGLENMEAMFKNIFPGLSNRQNVPEAMQKLVDIKAKGIHTMKGFYDYTEEEARAWNEVYAEFNNDIHKLAAQYPSKSKEKT
jgi:3-hydroxybutyryl-CoA dehydrogenase